MGIGGKPIHGRQIAIDVLELQTLEPNHEIAGVECLAAISEDRDTARLVIGQGSGTFADPLPRRGFDYPRELLWRCAFLSARLPPTRYPIRASHAIGGSMVSRV